MYLYQNWHLIQFSEEVPVEEAPATEEVNGDPEETAGEEECEDDAGFCDLDRETVRNAFHIFDTDGNGVISSDELGNLLRTLGQEPTEAHINELIEVRCIWSAKWRQVQVRFGSIAHVMLLKNLWKLCWLS